jgi:signal transduction histidine kinase
MDPLAIASAPDDVSDRTGSGAICRDEEDVASSRAKYDGRAPFADRLLGLVDAGATVSSDISFEQLLQRLVRIACGVVGARYGALGVIDEVGTGLANFVHHGVSAQVVAAIGHLPIGRGLLGALISDPRPIRLEDLHADRRSVGFPSGHPPMRSFLGVPVTSKGRTFGNLYLTEKRDGTHFTEEDEQLAIALATQAGIAVENHRLLTAARASAEQARRRLEELNSVQDVGAALLRELDPGEVLRTVAQRAKELVRADTAIVVLGKPDDPDLKIETIVGRGSRAITREPIPLDGSMAGEVLRTGGAAIVHDVEFDPRAHPIARALGARSMMFAALVDRSEPVGVLVVGHRRPDRFTDDDLFMLRSFADLASLALRNARLITAERRRFEVETELGEAYLRERMRSELLRNVIRAQEEERRRIARDLHDSAGQTVASILLGLKVAEGERTVPEMRARLADLRGVASAAAGELRRLALELRPSVLDDLGLEAAVSRYAREFTERTGIPCSIRLELGDRRVDPEVETVLYRVAQEALTNVTKYAAATRVRIRLSSRDGRLRLVIRDDGKGFDPGSADVHGLGLQGMRERADLIGGTLVIRSAVGDGTSVELEAPERQENM